MSDHLTKALFLGAALLLFAVALTVFITFYQDYQIYFNQANENAELNHLQRWETAGNEAVCYGYEVINMTLEKKRLDESLLLEGLYDSNVVPSTDSIPDIVIDGVNYATWDLSAIEPSDSYEPVFLFDSEGKTIRIDYIKR